LYSVYNTASISLSSLSRVLLLLLRNRIGFRRLRGGNSFILALPSTSAKRFRTSKQSVTEQVVRFQNLFFDIL
jgi:hypothetical protein